MVEGGLDFLNSVVHPGDILAQFELPLDDALGGVADQWVGLGVSIQSLAAQHKKISRQLAEAAQAGAVKRELEELKRKNSDLVKKVEESGNKIAELETALRKEKEEKMELKANMLEAEKAVLKAETAASEAKKKAEEARTEALGESETTVKALRDEIARMKEEADRLAEVYASSLKNAKVDTMKKWFASQQCIDRDNYLIEQQRYSFMDFAAERVARHFNITPEELKKVDLKMDPKSTEEKSYFYNTRPVPIQLPYDDSLNEDFPEDDEEEEGGGVTLRSPRVISMRKLLVLLQRYLLAPMRTWKTLLMLEICLGEILM